MYSHDVRKIAIRLYENYTHRKVATFLSVSASTVCRWVHQQGHVTSRRQRRKN